MRVNWVELGVALAALTLPHGARAATTRTSLWVQECDAAEVPANRLLELTRTELAPRTLLPSDGVQGAEITLVVRLCQGSAHGVMLELHEAGALRSLRQVDLSDVLGDLRPRTLAIALAELVAAAPPVEQSNQNAVAPPEALTSEGTIRSSNSPEQATLTPKQPAKTAVADKVEAPRVGPPTRPLQPQPTEHARPALKLGAGAALREFVKSQTTLLGPWLSVATHRFSADAQLLTTSSNMTLGTVALYDVNLAAIYEVFRVGSAVSSAAHLRAEFGQTWAKGTSRYPAKVQAHSNWATQLGLAVDVTVEAPLARHLDAALHLQSGVARGIATEADQRVIAGTQGFFLGACVGLNYGSSVQSP